MTSSWSVPPSKFQSLLCTLDGINPTLQGYVIGEKISMSVCVYVFTCILHTLIQPNSRLDTYMVPDVIIIPHRKSKVEITFKITLFTLQRNKIIGQYPQ